MAGIYIHIPFCKKKCIYCDFYSIGISQERKTDYLAAVKQEYEHRIVELADEQINTLYIGGGTPSLLEPKEVAELIRMVNTDDDAEITIEVNPDDITVPYVNQIKEAGVNRISMGIQSFDDAELQLLHRRHDSKQALRAVSLIKDAGITNISIDLIYGIPGQTIDSWCRSVDVAVSLNVPHISAYSLTYEEGTALTRMREQRRLTEVSDENYVRFYNHLVKALSTAGYHQYEISNFALPDYESRHNSAYWQFVPYLGLGAAAHSFDGHIRRYNPSDIKAYIQNVRTRGCSYVEEEETDNELYNEWVMTGLRTSHGIDINLLLERFGKQRWQHFRNTISGYIANDYMEGIGSTVHLTQRGIPISDMIFRDLFIVE